VARSGDHGGHRPRPQCVHYRTPVLCSCAGSASRRRVMSRGVSVDNVPPQTRFLKQEFPVSSKTVTRLRTVVIFGTSQDTNCRCFTDSNKRFRCEAIIENKHTFCSDYMTFVPAQLLWKWNEWRPSKQGDLDSNVTDSLFHGENLIPISVCTIVRDCWVSFYMVNLYY
jgi:hypothetical protein